MPGKIEENIKKRQGKWRKEVQINVPVSALPVSKSRGQNIGHSPRKINKNGK